MFKKKPYLVWDISHTAKLSERSALEHVLNYGDWDDVMEMERLMGIQRMKEVFEDIKNKKRVNLRPSTVNYFTEYFARYA